MKTFDGYLIECDKYTREPYVTETWILNYKYRQEKIRVKDILDNPDKYDHYGKRELESFKRHYEDYKYREENKKK
jgi:hypothetical protein